MKFLTILGTLIVFIASSSDGVETLYQPSEECVICLEEDPQICVRPCNHFCLCKSCSAKLKEKEGCPICRGKVEDLETIDS